MATRATHPSHPRASLPALSAVSTSFVRLTLYPGPRTGARDRTTLIRAAGRPASLRTQRRRGWRARTLRKWLIPAGSLASVLVLTLRGRHPGEPAAHGVDGGGRGNPGRYERFARLWWRCIAHSTDRRAGESGGLGSGSRERGCARECGCGRDGQGRRGGRNRFGAARSNDGCERPRAAAPLRRATPRPCATGVVGRKPQKT